MPDDWRTIPAGEVERVIADYNQGVFPACYEQLKGIAARVGYAVLEVPTDLQRDAHTDHLSRVIAVSVSTPGQMTTQLLHEVSEILLRLPVAAEYHFPPTGVDQHHEGAKLVEESRRRILTRQAQVVEAQREHIEAERRKLAEQMQRLEVQARSREQALDALLSQLQ